MSVTPQPSKIVIPPIEGFDTPDKVLNKKHALIAQTKKRAVGIYLRPQEDRGNRQTIDEYHSVGIGVWGIFELGNPTTPAYFSAAKGESDAKLCAAVAKKWAWPAGKPIAACYDLDASFAAVVGGCTEYAKGWHNVMHGEGYSQEMAYGSGALIMHLLSLGLISHGYLAGSTGFAGYRKYLPLCDIEQGNENATLLGVPVDLDIVHNPQVLWMPS